MAAKVKTRGDSDASATVTKPAHKPTLPEDEIIDYRRWDANQKKCSPEHLQPADLKHLCFSSGANPTRFTDDLQSSTGFFHAIASLRCQTLYTEEIIHACENLSIKILRRETFSTK